MKQDHAAIARFRSRITELIGLYVDDSKFAALTTVLQTRLRAKKLDMSAYLDWLASQSQEANVANDELRQLARELTVTETYFLRNIDQFHAFAQVALPERLAAFGDRQQLNILSAACASGEEAYSLAITVREQFPAVAEHISITAIDLNPAMLQKAGRARYSKWSLRDMSEELKKRWFQVEGDAHVLHPQIQRAVKFESRNLAQPEADFWLPERFDIIFCRNVLMYFSPEQMQSAVDRIARSLVPGGYLFLGHAESLRAVSDDFHLCQSNNTFYYQRKERLALPLPRQLTAAPVSGMTTIAQGPPDISWVSGIQEASERIRVLADDTRPALPATPAVETSSATTEQTNGLLQKALTLSHSGLLAQAEEICNELLSRGECNAVAHYLLALCQEGAGNLAGAIEHDRSAALFDTRFAMPRLHLGMMARRQGDRTGARNELESALLLLETEDEIRIAMFGGGFRREALYAMCHAELNALGERP